MNIENLNPENNNQNNMNPTEPNIAPVEPNFGNPPTSGSMDVPPAPMQTPSSMDVPPAPMQAPSSMDVPPAPMQTPSSMDVPPAPMQTPSSMDVPPAPMQMPSSMDVPPAPMQMPSSMDVPPAPMQTPSSMDASAPVPGTINLSPEGVVSNSTVVDPLSPLMSAPLTSNTPLMGAQSVETQNDLNSNINNPNNTINELPTNPATFGGVPTPSGAPVVDNLPNMPVKKKKGKKVLLIVLIFVLILGIGGGVYYFLNIANAKPSISVVPNINQWELGTALSKNVSDYAVVNGVESSACTVNTDAINVNMTGSYSYSISCPGLVNPVSATLEVRDTKGPDVKLKEVLVKPNTEVLVTDFIDKCEDPSIDDECDIKINDESIDLEELVKKEGTYSIPLIIKDNYDHGTIVNATLKVDSNAPSEFLICELDSPKVTSLNATISENYEYGINDLNEIATVTKKITYKFKSKDDYDLAKTEYEEDKTIDSLKGDASFDDKKFEIELSVDVPLEDLQSDLNSDEELKTYEDIAIFHESAGDVCSLP